MVQPEEQSFMGDGASSAMGRSSASSSGILGPLKSFVSRFYQVVTHFRTKKMSIFTVYVSLVVMMFLPSIFYMDTNISLLPQNHIDVDTETTLRKLQKYNADNLAYLVFPSETRNNEVLFDPRLVVASWLNSLKFHLKENKGVLDPNFELPFSWSEWVDLNSKFKLNHEFINHWKSEHQDHKKDNFTEMTCDQFRMLFADYEKFVQETCVDLTDVEKEALPSYPFRFKIHDRTGFQLEEPGRILYGASFLQTSAPPPARVHFLGAGLNKSSVIINTQRNPVTHEPVILDRSKDIYSVSEHLLENEARWRSTTKEKVIKDGIRLDHMVNEIQNLYNYDASVQPCYAEDELVYDKSYLLKLSDQVNVMTKVAVTEKDFYYDHEEIMNTMKQKIEQIVRQDPNVNKDTLLDHLLLKQIEREMDVFESSGNAHPAYLREAYMVNTLLGAHFDWRFFNGLDHPVESHQAVIHRIGRAWLRFCYQSGYRTFVAYGSMLGWIRNGLALPWDEDIDVIVSVDSLYKIARNHNQTLVVDVSQEDKYASGIGSFFLDIGSSFYSRVRGSGANAIDGRMIDTSSGVYVDITAIAWTPDYFDEHPIDEVMRTLVDPDYRKKVDIVEDKEAYEKQIDVQANELQNEHKIFHCRNNNVFQLDDLNPMVPTFFEGVRTHVPHKFKELLDRKYPRALDRNYEPEFNPHLTYKKNLRLWVEDAQCPGDDNEGALCQDEDVLEEYIRTKDYTARHLQLLETVYDNALRIEDETVPMKYDDFIIKYADLLNARLG
ncbi:hypothetical protein OGAPHI_007329 [Ogataea philodendri]|uniref:LicD/FKTN/FKRP nucleotidyltransferase domain-containing protein n=1 Tax=Ogataea philodendri TaxID=1378263 RepID=A0A9P8SZI2_9ASCO|nr:uncharacterized protein OGAPHI_007329 [Ogataea philodendri]KAH3660124.1 hypothetical protein OGAPHI_007329 [Ogataea philodendri]